MPRTTTKEGEKKGKEKATEKVPKKKEAKEELKKVTEPKARKATEAKKEMKKEIKKEKEEDKEKLKKKVTEPVKKTKTGKMRRFKVSGTFMMGDTLQKFQKDVEALGEKRAQEKVFQDLGSKHHVRRSWVIITSVEETK